MLIWKYIACINAKSLTLDLLSGKEYGTFNNGVTGIIGMPSLMRYDIAWFRRETECGARRAPKKEAKRLKLCTPMGLTTSGASSVNLFEYLLGINIL